MTGIASKYLMNDIPRGTTSDQLRISIFGIPAQQVRIDIADSEMDDNQSVATLEFDETPEWLGRLGSFFHYPTALGTVWGGVDMHTDDSGKTAFTRAVLAGNIKLAELLAEFTSTDINAVDKNGWSALRWACHMDLFEPTEFCLALSGMNTAQTCPQGLTAFDIAFYRGHRSNDESIPLLFFQSTFDMDRSDPDGALLRTLTLTTAPVVDQDIFPAEALFRPSASGNDPLVQALIARGVNVTGSNSRRETALHLACQGGHAEVVRSLTQTYSRGERSDVNAVADGGLTPLHYAARRGSPETVRVLLRRSVNKETFSAEGLTALHYAAKRASPDTVKVLVGLGANKGAKSRNGWTALDYASELDDSETVAFLISSDARPEEGVHTGATPLDRATRNRNRPLPLIMKMILDIHADVDEKDSDGNTALYLAAESGQLSVVELLLKRGANVQGGTDGSSPNTNQQLVPYSPDREGSAPPPLSIPPLLAASRNGHLEIVQMLLKWGADIEAASPDHITALQGAAATGKLEVVRLLLDHGANTETGEGRGTALHQAAMENHVEVVRFLLERGANRRARNWNSETPFEVAREPTIRALLRV